MGISNVKQLMADGGKIQVDNNGIPDFKHDYKPTMPFWGGIIQV